jgi:hypothetical protein
MRHTIGLAVSRTLALYGFAGWAYIALAALIHPYTLRLQLTHFTAFPHEDTFGEVSFVTSAISFLIYNLLRLAEGKPRVDTPLCSSASPPSNVVAEKLRTQGPHTSHLSIEERRSDANEV